MIPLFPLFDPSIKARLGEGLHLVAGSLAILLNEIGKVLSIRTSTCEAGADHHKSTEVRCHTLGNPILLCVVLFGIVVRVHSLWAESFHVPGVEELVRDETEESPV